MWKRAVVRLVDASGRRPWIVLLVTALVIAATWGYASRLTLRSDFIELLPRDSPGFLAYEHQLGRVGGGASFTFVVESPSRDANKRFIDDLSARLEARVKAHATCEAPCADAACKRACGEELIVYFENGTRSVKDFYAKNKWLYADQADLEDADRTLDQQIAFQSGMVEDLEDDDSPAAPKGKSPGAPGAPGAGTPAAPEGKKPALGLDSFRERWDSVVTKHDDFPTGYFALDDGTRMVLRVVTRAAGTGEASADRFAGEMDRLVKDLNPTTYDAKMAVGYAGDIPNAKAEKDSIINEAVGATVLALLVVIGGIVIYFRSVWSLLIVALPVFVGIGSAYAFATAAFGYVNTVGAFLGAIILGNGINYPIVLLSRYREFRALGMDKDVARREAVLNAFRAELVGAAVAAIAYGSLTITRFRGFSQFGLIGFVGMLLVWASIIPIVPALIVLVERLSERLPRLLRDPAPRPESDGSSGPIARFAARFTARRSLPIVVVTGALAVVAAVRLPAYLRDPWEYDFHNLGSHESHSGGPGEWTNKADAVFKGKMDISGVRMLADSGEQVGALKDQILKNDRKDPKGSLIEKIVTIDEFLPGTPAEQAAKLAVLDRIRDRLTPNVIANLDDKERARVLDMRPPETLAPIAADGLPALLRRRFEENDGRIGTVFYVQYRFGVSVSDGHTVLRIAKTTDNVTLPDGTLVRTASRASVYAEMIRSMERDGPLATFVSFFAVLIVVLIATRERLGAFAVILSLTLGVLFALGGTAYFGTKLNFINFIALPITFGIGCEYPFNIFDRTRLLKGHVSEAVRRSGGAVMLCSYTTIVGYGSLLISDQQAVQSFGRLAVLGELACITMAIFFLPSLLHLFHRRRREAEGA